MQGVSLTSVRNLVSAEPHERRRIFEDAVRQVRQDVRKRRWEWLCRRGVFVTETSGRERYLVTVGQDSISRTLFVYGECDYDNVEKVHRLLGRTTGSRRLMDVGANIGSICIPAVARGAAQVAVAIEPEPLNHSLLMINVRLNGLEDQVRVIQAAAGEDDATTLSLVINTENRGDHQIAAAPGAVPGAVFVPSITMDAVGTDFVAQTDLIWMDIQGFEGHALRGAGSLIERRVPLVMEFWPEALQSKGTSVHELVDRLSLYGSWFDLSEHEPRPRPLSGLIERAAELLDARSAQYYVDVLLV